MDGHLSDRGTFLNMSSLPSEGDLPVSDLAAFLAGSLAEALGPVTPWSLELHPGKVAQRAIEHTSNLGTCVARMTASSG
jgi:hypothetical protein